MILKEKLSENVKLLGKIDSRNVRKYMEEANIFLLTSDQNEGWGAVVNEAMNSACVVIGNQKIGSIPYLIKNGKNGFMYLDKSDLFNIVEKIIENKEEQKIVGKNAYYTIIKTWNAKNAANNFIEVCNSLLKNKKYKVEEGPCSNANII